MYSKTRVKNTEKLGITLVGGLRLLQPCLRRWMGESRRDSATRITVQPWSMILTTVPAGLPGMLFIWQGAVAVGSVCQGAFLLHNVQLVFIIGLWAALHHIIVVSDCRRGRGGHRLEWLCQTAQLFFNSSGKEKWADSRLSVFSSLIKIMGGILYRVCSVIMSGERGRPRVWEVKYTLNVKTIKVNGWKEGQVSWKHQLSTSWSNFSRLDET